MSETSSPNDLTSRLRSQLEADRKQIEETAVRELARLGENLSAVASGALSSIEADTEEATGRMRELLMRAWLRPLVVGMSLFLGICGGSWATMHWLSRSIHDRIETYGGNWTCGPIGAHDAGRDRGDDLGRGVAGEQRGPVRVAARRHAGPSGMNGEHPAGSAAANGRASPGALSQFPSAR